MIFGLMMIVYSYTAATLVSAPSLFFLTLLIAGLSVESLEVAVILEADRVEYGLEQRSINRSHRFWSLGFFATGLSGALMAQLAVPVVFHFAGLGLIIVALTIFNFSGVTQAPPRPSANTGTLKFVRPAAVNVVALAQIAFVVFLLTPPVLGVVAEYIGIRYAFAIYLTLAVLSLLSPRSLSPAPSTTR